MGSCRRTTHPQKTAKITLFCQAWYLGYYGTALFEEDFEAWVHSPVIRKVYETYKSYGSNPITFQSLCSAPEDEQESEPENKRPELETELGKQKVEFLNDALDFYGRKSAFWLEMRGHQD